MVKREVHTGLWWGDLMERDHLGDLGVGGNIILKWIFKKWDRVAWAELVWLGTRTGGGRF
jgi:hypothetical protein